MEASSYQRAVEHLIADSSAARGAEGGVVDEIVALLDRGELRVCEPRPDGWVTHAWVKQAILLYFARHESREMADPDTGLTFFDKVPTKRNYAELGVRCVPPGVARYGSFLARGCILMPGYVNIGAYVDEGTMVDTWATVGSCAQIGKGVHLSGGVGIGGVLEPAQAQPVIVEDGCFIGSRCIVVEGVLVEREAVLGANVVLTASTPIVDVTGSEPAITRGRVPARSVVIPGTMPKRFPAGEYQVPCALIVGQRKESTDRKTTLNAALRDFGVSA
ncbi:MAG TPA: 2,3,4,5-tetrahydropyridine-2,6-dicarboxylate N-succinyltransferase [Candidatus Dormibacteraeota bacterium]|nr:2,3,4,5-tetrahydropyridine-2,6-dicarboxylate N-succinyltransferase [Candidatus Dormibacteraeota bacterium]